MAATARQRAARSDLECSITIPGVTGAPGRFTTPSSDLSGATRAAKPDRISDPLCRTDARPITLPGLLSGPDPGSSSGEGGGSGSGRGGIGVGSSGRGCGGCWGMARPRREVSEHDAAKRVPGVWTLRRSGAPANNEDRHLLTHAASTFLQEASGNSTNENALPAQRSGKHLIDAVVWSWHAACDRKTRGGSALVARTPRRLATRV